MIRTMQQQDRAVFLALSEEFYHSPAVLAPIPASYHEKTFDELLRSEAYLVGFLFEVEGEAAGYALLNRSFSHEAGGAVVWVEELYVRPGYQGHGIGTRFFSYLKAHYPAARYRLETEPENVRAKALYAKMGFQPLAYEQMICDTAAD